MDSIYNFLRSPDVAEHCRKIGKTWNTYEKAVIIGRSYNTADYKRKAFLELINNEPDMDTHFISGTNPLRTPHEFSTIHEELKHVIELEDGELGSYFEWYYADIPVPFKHGDILARKGYEKVGGNIFVLARLDRDNPKQLERSLNSTGYDNYITEGWGYFVNENGIVYGGHVHDNDTFEYYRGGLHRTMRPLLALSNFIKEKPEISEDLLLNAYEVMLREKHIEKLKYAAPYIDECLACAGLIEGEEKEMTEEEQDAYFGGTEGPYESVEEMNAAMAVENWDVYDFIPSLDIAYHCRKIQHIFTPTEQAVIIYRDEKLPMSYRHKCWQKIIDTLPDEKLIERPGEKGEKLHHESLHEYLREYMRIENTLADRLKEKEPGTIYTFSTRYKTRNENGLIEPNSYYSTQPYSSYEAVIEAIREECAVESECFERVVDRTFYVHKRWIDTDKELSASVSTVGVIYDLSCGNMLSEADTDMLTALDLIDIYVPVPFEKGDILTFDGWTPFVLADDDWEYGKMKYPNERRFRAEGCIMDAIHSYTVNENGHIYFDFHPASLSIEYYRHNLTGLNRILIAISSYIKGEIPVDLMMNACSIIISEDQEKSLRGNMHYTDEGLALVGLSRKKGK